jgi:WD40 repeat protein
MYSPNPSDFSQYEGNTILWEVPVTGDQSGPAAEAVASTTEDLSFTAATSIRQPIRTGLPIDALAISPDGRKIAMSIVDGTIELWDVHARHAIGQPFHAGNVVSDLVFSPNGGLLAIASEGSVVLWDPSTAQPVGEPLGQPSAGSYIRLAFSPDGSLLAADNGPERSIILWDVGTQQPIGQPILDSTDSFTTFAFTQDGKYLALGIRNDGRAVLWDVAGQKLAVPLNQATDAERSTSFSGTFSGDGKILASSGDNGLVRLWDVTTQAFLTQRLTALSGTTVRFAFSPSHALLASSDDSGALLLWDVNAQQEIGHLMLGNTAFITGMAFSPDEKTLMVADETGALTFWGVDPETWIDKTCQRAGANLTLPDWQRFFPNQEYRKTCEEFPKDVSFYETFVEDALSESKDVAHMRAALDALRNEMRSDTAIEDPNAKAAQLILSSALLEIAYDSYDQKWDEVFDLLNWMKEEKLPLYTLHETDSLNSICWDASLDGLAENAMEYCEAAVTLAPFDADIRDSRGVARALSGDYAGALEDFQYFVLHSEDADAVEKRTAWIEELKNGTNPLTPRVREELLSR